jgi:hypothetical protein
MVGEVECAVKVVRMGAERAVAESIPSYLMAAW